MKFSLAQKREIVADVNAAMRVLLPGIPLRTACLHYAAITSLAVAKRGVRTVLQAGSASWRFKAPGNDDGGPTHFTYTFDPNDLASAARLAAGAMPEIHCWVGIPKTDEIVDLTTGFLPELLTVALPSEKWTQLAPPPFFWGPRATLPDGWHYWATIDAIRIAFGLLRDSRPDLYEDMRRRGLTPPAQ
jgi:hypothetical protein